MAGDSEIALRELPLSDSPEQHYGNTEQDGTGFAEADARQWESRKKRAMVIVGSGLLQLPIWGMSRAQSYHNASGLLSNFQALP
jgi:hypothetical protein